MAWSASVATIAGGFAAYVSQQVKSPLHHPIFEVLAGIAAVAFLILIAAGIPDFYNWASALVAEVRPPFPAITRRWEFTTDGRLAALGPIAKPMYMDLPGTDYMKAPEERSPWVRFVVVMACTVVSPDYDPNESLRSRFQAFLQRPPVMELVRLLTHVAEDDHWILRAEVEGEGYDAMLAPADGADGVASARLILPWGVKADWHDRRYATLILHVSPRGKDGQPTPPAVPFDWIKRMYWALEMPPALQAFLSQELGARVTGEPPAVLAVHMEAMRDMIELVDITDLESSPGGTRRQQAFGFFIASPFGVPRRKAVNRLIHHMLSYALAVDV